MCQMYYIGYLRLYFFFYQMQGKFLCKFSIFGEEKVYRHNVTYASDAQQVQKVL